MYAEASPTSYITPDDPPVFLAHGDADTIVPFSQSEILQAELAKGGVPVEFIPVPGGTHGNLSDAPNAPDYLGAIVNWFDQHLQN